MALPNYQIHIPIETDEHGEMFVEGTRVPIDIIIHEFKNGTTPEQVVQNFDSLDLSDVYAIIGYYLQNTTEIETYLTQQKQALNVARQAAVERFKSNGVREMLLARQKRRQNS